MFILLFFSLAYDIAHRIFTDVQLQHSMHLQDYAFRVDISKPFDITEVNSLIAIKSTTHKPYTQSQLKTIHVFSVWFMEMIGFFLWISKFTYLLTIQSANEVAKYGTMICNENSCSCRLLRSWNISMTLNVMIEAAIINDWPASSPFIPAKMLMALVQKTANIPM